MEQLLLTDFVLTYWNSYRSFWVRYRLCKPFLKIIELAAAPSRLRPTQLRTLLRSNLIYLRPTSLHPPKKFPFSFISLSLWFPLNTRWGRPSFFLVLDGWPTRTVFGNLSSFIRRTWPSYLNLFFIIALESGIEPHLSYNLLFWNTVSPIYGQFYT